MESILIIALVVFLLTAFLIWKTTSGPIKKEFGEKRWKLWGQRTFYWQEVIYLSTGITYLFLIGLKWANVLPF